MGEGVRTSPYNLIKSSFSGNRLLGKCSLLPFSKTFSNFFPPKPSSRIDLPQYSNRVTIFSGESVPMVPLKISFDVKKKKHQTGFFFQEKGFRKKCQLRLFPKIFSHFSSTKAIY